jgi:hypothetical protein
VSSPSLSRSAPLSGAADQGRQTIPAKFFDFLTRTTIASLAYLWARKWRYAIIALLLLTGEVILLRLPDLSQSLSSGGDPARIGAILWDGIANAGDQWWILPISALILVVILPLCARWVYRREYPGVRNEALAPYVARRVSQLLESDYVPKHAYEIDTRHPTTRLVRAALRTAERSSLSRARVSPIAPLPIGVCIFGRPLHDKTGLAWVAMRKVLPGWSCVRWPHRFEHPEGIETMCGSRVVLWLDDLHEYANHVEAAQLDALIDRFASDGVQVVVVATCRWHEDEREARARLGYLFDHLLPIRLTEQPDDHSADPLVVQPTIDAPIKRSGRATGTIELTLQNDLEAKRNVYESLLTGDDAARSAATILRAMSFLRRVGVRVYSRSRVRGVAIHIGLDPGDVAWAKGLNVLQERDYIQPLSDFHTSRFRKWLVRWWRRMRGKGPRALADLEPVTIWYLDRVVGDAAQTPGNVDLTLNTVWEALRYGNDAEALTLLGDAYLNPRNVYLRTSGKQSLNCYTAALVATGVTGASGHVIRRAAAHLGLGHAHMASAGLLGRDPRKTALDSALDAFTNAASEAAPDLLRAEAFQGQGNAHVALADHAAGENQTAAEKSALTHAQTAFGQAVTRYTRAHSPFQWATAQYELANTRKRLARIAIGEAPSQPPAQETLTLLVSAEAGYQQARNVYTRANAPTDWAKIQRDLAEAQIRWVIAVNATALDDALTISRNRRLEEAVDALRAAVLIFRQFGMQDDAASANALLGDALSLEAQGMRDSQEKQEKFADAYEALAATLTVNRRSRRPLDFAEANVKLAAIALHQAKLANAGFGAAPYGVDARVYAERARDSLYRAYVIYRPPYKPPFDDPKLTLDLNACALEVRNKADEVRLFGVAITFE